MALFKFFLVTVYTIIIVHSIWIDTFLLLIRKRKASTHVHLSINAITSRKSRDLLKMKRWYYFYIKIIVEEWPIALPKCHKLKLEQHSDKTLIGRTERGFDFLGYHFKPGRLSVAGKSLERLMESMTRLYEQGVDPVRIGSYVKRWFQWAHANHILWLKEDRQGRIQYRFHTQRCLPGTRPCSFTLNFPFEPC